MKSQTKFLLGDEWVYVLVDFSAEHSSVALTIVEEYIPELFNKEFETDDYTRDCIQDAVAWGLGCLSLMGSTAKTLIDSPVEIEIDML